MVGSFRHCRGPLEMGKLSVPSVSAYLRNSNSRRALYSVLASFLFHLPDTRLHGYACAPMSVDKLLVEENFWFASMPEGLERISLWHGVFYVFGCSLKTNRRRTSLLPLVLCDISCCLASCMDDVRQSAFIVRSIETAR